MQKLKEQAWSWIFITFAVCTPGWSSQDPGATAEVEIRVSTRPQDTELSVKFLRSETSRSQLLVTALPIPPADKNGMHGAIELASFDDYVSHFGGWFVARSESHELWLGSSLEKGQSQGELTVRAPGLLRALPIFPEKYELIWRPPETVARELAAGSPVAQYADVVSVVATIPSEFRATPQDEVGWKPLTAGRYLLSPHNYSHRDPHVLLIERLPNDLMNWLQDAFPTFATCFFITATAIMVAVVEIPFISRRRRLILGGLAIGTVAIALLAVGDGPNVFKSLLFSADGLVGVFLALVLFFFVPHKAIRAARDATDRIRFGSSTTSI